jgi:hypothetical protein
MTPEDTQKLFRDLLHGMSVRADYKSNKDQRRTESVREHYNEDMYSLYSGICAGVRSSRGSGYEVELLKEEYGETFAEGIDMGEELYEY